MCFSLEIIWALILQTETWLIDCVVRIINMNEKWERSWPEVKSTWATNKKLKDRKRERRSTIVCAKKEIRQRGQFSSRINITKWIFDQSFWFEQWISLLTSGFIMVSHILVFLCHKKLFFSHLIVNHSVSNLYGLQKIVIVTSMLWEKPAPSGITNVILVANALHSGVRMID